MSEEKVIKEVEEEVMFNIGDTVYHKDYGKLKGTVTAIDHDNKEFRNLVIFNPTFKGWYPARVISTKPWPAKKNKDAKHNTKKETTK